MTDLSASQQIDNIVNQHTNWKGDVLAQLRTIVTQVDDSIFEEVKWKTPSRPEGLPVWSSNGIVCIAEIWKDNVKLVFFEGADLDDPSRQFNARLKSRTDRAIEFKQDSAINEAAIQELVRQAVQLNETR